MSNFKKYSGAFMLAGLIIGAGVGFIFDYEILTAMAFGMIIGLMLGSAVAYLKR